MLYRVNANICTHQPISRTVSFKHITYLLYQTKLQYTIVPFLFVLIALGLHEVNVLNLQLSLEIRI
jgi:hypothetical protein